MNIILASKSPRRKEILQSIGIDFKVFTAHCDENIGISSPKKLVTKLSEKKAYAVFDEYKKLNDTTDTLFIAADTVVCIKNKILGKPKNSTDAKEMLNMLCNKSHKVITGITLIYNGTTVTSCESTKVYFKHITPAEIDAYIKTGEPMDKAGAYAIQGGASRWIRKIKGDYFNVVGLPIFRLCELASRLDIRL